MKMKPAFQVQFVAYLDVTMLLY